MIKKVNTKKDSFLNSLALRSKNPYLLRFTLHLYTLYSPKEVRD